MCEPLPSVTLPLPPPPPPLPHLCLSSPKKSEMTDTLMPASCKHLPLPEISKNISYFFKDSDINIVSFCKPVQPVIQEGPCCGIVALSMASQFFSDKYKTSEEILASAKLAKFTKRGEMFSAFNMATLSSSLIDCEASVINNLSQNSQDILHNVCLGYPVLIPYDADKNHEPCLNKGLNAHWAILCGICFSVSKDLSSLFKNFTVDNEIPYIFNMVSGTETEQLLNFASKIGVFAYQGKSKHLALWDLDALILSNNNLFEVTNKYSLDDLIIPSNGLSELNDKAVLLKERA
ncbi:UPF0692 protein C19orf54 homolog [Nephila pilipes]|uniref:Actin maturation protease n=1 Tax=Nephila pilipes TaxID=299642 RepID=A0A8X6NET0_NEPPI|nr:UPF0692 protein C19orf54 homolog [Nephila pilipes]